MKVNRGVDFFLMDMGIRIGRERVEKVVCFKYLGVVIISEGDRRQEFEHRLKEGSSALGLVRGMEQRGNVNRDEKEFLKL